MLTYVATILVGIWLIVEHAKLPDSTLTLIFGVAIGVLALVDLVRLYWPVRQGR